MSPRGKTTAEQQEGVCLLNSHPQASASPSVTWVWRETQAVATTQGTVLGSLPARIGFVWSKCDLYPLDAMCWKGREDSCPRLPLGSPRVLGEAWMP